MLNFDYVNMSEKTYFFMVFRAIFIDQDHKFLIWFMTMKEREKKERRQKIVDGKRGVAVLYYQLIFTVNHFINIDPYCHRRFHPGQIP